MDNIEPICFQDAIIYNTNQIKLYEDDIKKKTELISKTELSILNNKNKIEIFKDRIQFINEIKSQQVFENLQEYYDYTKGEIIRKILEERQQKKEQKRMEEIEKEEKIILIGKQKHLKNLMKQIMDKWKYFFRCHYYNATSIDPIKENIDLEEITYEFENIKINYNTNINDLIQKKLIDEAIDFLKKIFWEIERTLITAHEKYNNQLLQNVINIECNYCAANWEESQVIDNIYRCANCDNETPIKTNTIDFFDRISLDDTVARIDASKNQSYFDKFF